MKTILSYTVFLVALIATLGSDILIATESVTVKLSIRNDSEKRPEFAYRNIRISLYTLKGKPVSGARIYGYCPGFHLIWPSTERTGKGKDQRQDDLPWQETYFGRTGPDGTIVARIPPGRWAFFACGCWPDTGRVKKIVAAWSNYVEPTPDSQIVLRPTVKKNWSFEAPGTKPLRHNCFFLKPDHLPIWIPVEAPLPPQVMFEIPEKGQMHLWGQGNRDQGNPAFALHWGEFNSKTPDGMRQPVESPATLKLQGGQGQTSLFWFLHRQYGLTGRIRLGKLETALLSPGEYSLGYTCPLNQSFLAEFVPKYCIIQGEKKYSFDVDTKLAAGLMESSKYMCLFIVGRNGFLLRNFLTKTGKGVPCRAGLWVAGKMHPAKQMTPGRTLFKIPKGLSPEETRGAVREWTFELPITLSPQNRFAADQMTILSSDHFWTSVPAILESPMVNFLKQADQFEDRLRQLSQRTKKGVPRTWLRFPIRRSGASATHFGTRITFPSNLLYQDVPVLDHVFGHELGHNFELTHGGLHELIVECTRCAGNTQITGQISMWFFMDRMNGIKRKETWRPPTGIYVYGYSQGGLEFLRFVSHHEKSVRKAMTKAGFSKDAVSAALCEVALGRDLFDICRMYGLCSERSQHISTVEEVKKLVDKANPPQAARNSQQIMSDPPGWIVLAGKWRLKGKSLIGRRVRGLGSAPRLVYREMPHVPFEISFSQKNVKDSPNYVRLDFSLGELDYRLVLENEQLTILGPGEKQEYARNITSGEDNVYQLRIRVDEKEVTFALDGQTIHSIHRTSRASQGRVALWGKKRGTTTITNFFVTGDR